MRHLLLRYCSWLVRPRKGAFLALLAIVTLSILIMVFHGALQPSVEATMASRQPEDFDAGDGLPKVTEKDPVSGIDAQGRLLVSGGPVKPFKRPNSATPVHLVISAFRDGERCARTLAFALDKAKYPSRLHFRVLQALGKGGGAKDTSCVHHFMNEYLPRFCQKHSNEETAARVCEREVMLRLKAWTIPLEEGMGPAHQRGLLNEMLDFQVTDAMCMTTDSHMDFHHDWDELTIADWYATDNEFAVLTTYPVRMEDGQEEKSLGNHVDLCGYELERGIPRGKTGSVLATRQGDKPYFTMNWAAGFSFHRCHADRNVPVDKHLTWIFTGEEVSRAVRLWTHGYDLYLPSGITVYHNYTAAKQEFWRYQGLSQFLTGHFSRQRISALLQLGNGESPDLGLYGLGSQRSLEQWVKWSQVDLGTARWSKFLRVGSMKCSKLKRVPVKDVQRLNASIMQGGLPLRPAGTIKPVDLQL